MCVNNHSKDPNVSFYRFPSDPMKRGRPLKLLEMRESVVKSRMRVYSRDFPYVDISTPPNRTLGKRLASPIKRREPRAKAPATLRQECQQEYIQRREGSPFSKIDCFSATVQDIDVVQSDTSTLVLRYAGIVYGVVTNIYLKISVINWLSSEL